MTWGLARGQGVPLRMELGVKDLEKGSMTLLA